MTPLFLHGAASADMTGWSAVLSALLDGLKDGLLPETLSSSSSRSVSAGSEAVAALRSRLSFCSFPARSAGMPMVSCLARVGIVRPLFCE